MSAPTITPADEAAVSHPETPVGGARELALSLFAGVNEHDTQAALRLFDPDAQVHIAPIGLAGTASHEGRRFFESLVTAFPDLSVRVRSSIRGSREFAVAEIQFEGTQATDFLGILHRQKKVDLAQAWMIWAGGGRIVKFKVYWYQNERHRDLAAKRRGRRIILG